jgi:hypothetical protein
MNVSLWIAIVDGSLIQASVVVVRTCVSSCSEFVVAVSSIYSLRECRISGLNVRAREIGRCWDRVPADRDRLLGGYATAAHLLRGCGIGLSIIVACAQLLSPIRILLHNLNHIAAK